MTEMWEPDFRYGYVHQKEDRRYVMDDFGDAVPVPWYQEKFYFMGEH